MSEPQEVKPAGLIVNPSALTTIAKAQLRLAIAAIGGALVLRHALPAWLVNDQTIDLVAGVVALGVASAWSWTRAQIAHRRLVALAKNPAVPADEIRLKGESA